MNNAHINLITNIILGTATASDFAVVTTKWTDMFGFFEDNAYYLQVLIQFGFDYEYDFDDGVFISAPNRATGSPLTVYRIYPVDWNKRNYFVRFPDERIEEIE